MIMVLYKFIQPKRLKGSFFLCHVVWPLCQLRAFSSMHSLMAGDYARFLCMFTRSGNYPCFKVFYHMLRFDFCRYMWLTRGRENVKDRVHEYDRKSYYEQLSNCHNSLVFVINFIFSSSIVNYCLAQKLTDFCNVYVSAFNQLHHRMSQCCSECFLVNCCYIIASCQEFNSYWTSVV